MFGKLIMLSILFGVPPLVSFFGTFNYYSDYFKSIIFDSDAVQEYDFIVVGAGSAGVVVALRLSKNSRVLLLEAGGDPSPLNAVPLLAIDMLGHSATDWMYETEPQRNACIGFQNQATQWPRGKMLGGSSSLNYMLYLRGHARDYNNWANLTQDPSWNYENVLPYFKKSIAKYKGKFKGNKKHYQDSEYGFLHVENRDWKPLFKEFQEAGEELLGLPEIDANGPQTSGFGEIEVTQNRGERWGTYASILQNGALSDKLEVLKYSQVVKVELDINNRATGVRFFRHGKKRIAKASKEVILSAGAINSAHLLMLSGVGPKDHLLSKGIIPRVDLPVGQNLVDHVMDVLPPFVLDKPVSFIPDRDLNFGVFWDYYIHGKGPLTAPNGIVGQAFLSSKKVQAEGIDWPDIQLYFTAVGLYESLAKQFSRASKTKPGFIDSLVGPYIGKDAIVASIALVRPKSVGEVRLRDKNPFTPPIIDPNYLSHPDDVLALVEGVKTTIKLLEETSSFKQFNSTMSHVHIPGCEMVAFRSDDYWECAVRTLLTTVWHPVGTNRMGHKLDRKTVVDSRLRVLHTKGLRVIDSSVMPVIVNANTNAPTIAISEIGADRIREYWTRQAAICNMKHYYFFAKLVDNLCFYSKLF